MPTVLTYHLRRLGARLHRARVALRARGLRSLLDRAIAGVGPTGEKRPQPGAERSPLQRAAPAAGGLRILMIDVTTPRPDRDSGSVRAFNLMRLLADDGHQVDFLPDDRSDAGAPVDALRAVGVDVLTGDRAPAYPRLFRARLRDYDALVISRYHLAEFMLPLARHAAPGIRVVLDTVDLHFLREEREAGLKRDATLRRLARGTRRRELAAITRADATWVVSDAEQALLRDLVPGVRVEVLANIIDPVDTETTPAGRSGLLFVGGARHPPNVDAIQWLAADIMPRVRALRPDCTLHVAGEGTRALLGGQDAAGIVAHDHVDDLTPLLSHCRLGVAPLRFGAGVKGKVNLYMAHGLPVVLTGCAAEGMHLRGGEDALLADDAEGFAAAIIAACGDDALWRVLSANGRDSVRRHFSAGTARTAFAATFGAGR